MKQNFWQHIILPFSKVFNDVTITTNPVIKSLNVSIETNYGLHTGISHDFVLSSATCVQPPPQKFLVFSLSMLCFPFLNLLCLCGLLLAKTKKAKTVTTSICLFVFVFKFIGLKIEAWVSRMVYKCCTPELCPQPTVIVYDFTIIVYDLLCF